MAPSPVEELALLDLERSNKGASKQRRDQINSEIGTMRDLLPLPESARQRLSQLQIMSLSCVYIRKCNILQKMLPTNRCSIEVPCEFSSALTGFILVTTRDGKLVYISENVTEYLGHSMVDMKTQGDSLFDIVDKRDHGTVQAQLLHGVSTTTDGRPQGRSISFFCRMNMSRTLKRQGGFGDVKVMHVKGHFVPVNSKETGSTEQHVFTALCTPLITPDVKESLIQNNTTIFKSVHKLDMSFIELTETGEYHLGVQNSDINGQSWYSMLHPDDLTEARAKHMQLIKSRHEMGCMMTVRMLTQTNDVIWVNIVMHVRQALVSNSDDPVIVCINQVVSEDEAKQFKIQGQLFALCAARAPDIFFGSPHFHQLQQVVDPEMIRRQQAAQIYMQQQQQQQQQHGYYSEQQRFQYVTQPGQTGYPQQQSQYINGLDALIQRPQGHTSTIRALKRKLQENIISSCKPSKIARHGSEDSQDGNFSDYNGGETHYVMNVNVFRSSTGTGGQVIGNGSGIAAYTGETMPVVYQQAAQVDPVQAIRQKKALLMNSTSAAPAIVQKLAPTCTLEQVVPEVSIPECYLTPDPSPATSPKPLISMTGLKKETHDIKQLTTFVTDRLNELKQTQTVSENLPVKVDAKAAKRKNLPIIDATFVDSFFDELQPDGQIDISDIKTEPLSPQSAVQQDVPPQVSSHCSSIMTSKSPSPPPTAMPLAPNCGQIKEEITLEDCTDLEEFLGLVGAAGSEQQASPRSTVDSMSPVASPTSSVGCGSMCESSSPLAPSFGSSACIKQNYDQVYNEMSPCSSSPGYDGRNDILDPDNWLLEPISLPMDMTLADLEQSPVDVKQDSKDELYHLKQLLQQSWEPCGFPSADSHRNTQ